MILSREQVEMYRQCYGRDCTKTEEWADDCVGCKYRHSGDIPDLFDTIEHLQQESDRGELEHEKARRAAEVEFRETLDFMNATVQVIEQERDRLRNEYSKAIKLLEKSHEVYSAMKAEIAELKYVNGCYRETLIQMGIDVSDELREVESSE